jgi:hypothetical protein
MTRSMKDRTPAREAVRRALNEYLAELRNELAHTPRGGGDADNEFDHIKMSIAEVKSAKRVLWMED